MTDFFSNMINRHLGSTDVVEPRPRARFEPESGSTAAMHLPADNLEAEQSLIYQKKYNHSVTEDSTKPGLNISNKEGRFDAPMMQEQSPAVLNPVSDPLGEQRKVNSPPVEALQQITGRIKIPPAKEHEPSAEHRRHEASAEQIPGGAYSLKSDLDDRIEALLQRLRGSQNSQLLATGASKSDQSNPPEPGERDRNLNLYPSSSMPSQGIREESGNSSKQQADNLLPERRKFVADKSPESAISFIEPNLSPIGAFESPSWLAEMQAESNRRWQAMNFKAEAEPVINVTIGRVEVRAVQTEPPKQSKRKSKPISVMGLDEYLKQRGRRRT